MAKYTIELRWLIENGFPLPLQSYPIWQESYRKQLNDKIVRHYYFREIGFEVPGLFADRLQEKMSLIMPYYNKLYTALQQQYDPFQTTNIVETTSRDLSRDRKSTQQSEGSGTASGSSSSKSTGSSTASQDDTSSDTRSDQATSSNKAVRSDTPQGLLQASSVNANTWASDAQLDSGSTTGSGKVDHTASSDQSATSSNDTTGTTQQSTTNKTSGSGTENETVGEDVTHIRKGFEGTNWSQLMTQYRQALFSVDLMVLQELEELFMQIW